MKKLLSQIGVNGKFHGTVEVMFNYRSEAKEVHNPSTHDEDKRTFSYHHVVGDVNGEKFQSEDFQDPRRVFQYIDEIEKKVSARLYQLASTPKEKDVMEILKDRGYE